MHEIDCVTTAELVRATGMSPHHVDQFRKAGILNPIKGKPENGLGFLVYSLKDLLNVSVALELKRRGFKTEQVVNCLNWLLERSLPELREQWENGRTVMLAVGDVPAFPRLLSHAEVFGNPDIDLNAALQAGVSVVLVDVAEAYRQLASQVSEIRHAELDRRERDRKQAEQREIRLKELCRN